MPWQTKGWLLNLAILAPVTQEALVLGKQHKFSTGSFLSPTAQVPDSLGRKSARGAEV